METIKKVVIIGPESTGKTTLCSRLAEYYKTSWVPEYAREYLLRHGTDYSYEDLLTVAKGQIKLEEQGINEVLNSNYQNARWKKDAELTNIMHNTSTIVHPARLLFIDTDMYVMKVWCEYVFNNCHSWILNRIAERHYDGYILCNPDIDWVADALREYPDKTVREKLYYYYKDLMVNQAVPWVDITGDYNERFEKAINFIDKEI